MAINLDWSKIASGLSGVLSVVEEVAPAAALAGPEGALIGGIVAKAAEVSSNLLSLAQNAGTVLSSNDLAAITAADQAIQAQNDQLSQSIANS